jgi:hypothetical protein
MRRKNVLTIVVGILIPVLVLLGFYERLWDLSSLQYAPAEMAGIGITVVAYLQRDRLKKWSEGSEPIRPAYERRHYENAEVDALRLWFWYFGTPVLGLGSAGLYWFTFYEALTQSIDPYGYVCYKNVGCSYQTVIVLYPALAITASYALFGFLIIPWCVRRLITFFRNWRN